MGQTCCTPATNSQVLRTMLQHQWACEFTRPPELPIEPADGAWFHQRTFNSGNDLSPAHDMSNSEFWDLGPKTVRTYEGCSHKALSSPLPPDATYDQMFARAAVESQPLNHHSLAAFIRNSVAVSGRKKSGRSEWAMRVHASSGALYPIETYIISKQSVLDGSEQEEGPTVVYHYDVNGHSLEERISTMIINPA